MHAVYLYIQKITFVKINLTNILIRPSIWKYFGGEILGQRPFQRHSCSPLNGGYLAQQGEARHTVESGTRKSRPWSATQGRREKETNTSKEQSTSKGLFLTLQMPISLFVTAAESQNAKIKSRFLKSIFKVKSEKPDNQKSKVDLRTKKSIQKVSFQLEKSNSKVKSRFTM